MQYKIFIIILLFVYIYSGAIKEYISSPDDIYMKEMQEEITINQQEIDVFNKKNTDNINITEKRIKAWNIIITYNENNYENIKNKLIKSGYKVKHNQKKMYYSLGPFSDISHAKEESKKLNKLYGLNNKIIDLVF
tara:strand:- start:19181 stop:19585 length:405 start_codon:yes stop_codon:yes gene_type:complete